MTKVSLTAGIEASEQYSHTLSEDSLPNQTLANGGAAFEGQVGDPPDLLLKGRSVDSICCLLFEDPLEGKSDNPSIEDATERPACPPIR